MRLFPLFLLIISAKFSFAQTLSGFVQSSENMPIPYANVYIKYLNTGTSADDEGKYFFQFEQPGDYEIVFSAVGYQDKTLQIIVGDNQEVVKNVWLEPNIAELDKIVVNANKRDPAYDIIKKAIEHRDQWEQQFLSSTSTVYIKAKEVISEKERKRRERLKEEEKIQKQNEGKEEVDVFEAEKQANLEKINKIAYGMNMMEVQMKRHYQFPNNVKEIREAVKKNGDVENLFFQTTTEADFNFYTNLMNLENLNDVPLVSPLHRTSVLTYKFKLEETSFIGERMVYKIKVTPRKKGNASWKGYIWILDKDFCIHQLDLKLDNNTMVTYDEFSIKQEYAFTDDSVLVLSRQEFDYFSKEGSSRFTGSTIVDYSEYVINPEYDKKFFRNEVAVTTQKAYDRDTSYWGKIRPEALSLEEQRYQYIKDSIHAAQNTKEYLDSVDRAYNALTIGDILWDGIGFRNREKKRDISLNPLPGMLDFFTLGGVRVQQWLQYFKKLENEKFFLVYGHLSLGVRNNDVKGGMFVTHQFDPMKDGRILLGGHHYITNISYSDALSNMFERNNYIEETTIEAGFMREIVNGFSGYIWLSRNQNNPLNAYEFGTITEDWFDGNEIREFEAYSTFLAEAELSFTPFQKYMTEPNRKIILGSKWPTFTWYYEKGIPNLLGSVIDFDYTDLEVEHTFKAGTMGTSAYKLTWGKFLNINKINHVEKMIFPRGDQWLFASLMESMQSQDTTLTSTDMHFKAHYTHHFNGAIVNYIPMVKKLGLHVSAGASTLYIHESEYLYGEVFFGVERNFKLGRDRFRIGLFYVLAESNYANIRPGLKLAVNKYDKREKKWGY